MDDCQPVSAPERRLPDAEIEARLGAERERDHAQVLELPNPLRRAN
jgi:hypothetical protein